MNRESSLNCRSITVAALILWITILNTMTERGKDIQADFRFTKDMRLRKRGEFDRVFQRKQSAGDQTLVIYGMINDQSVSRLGLVVSKRIGKAHQRNRWKRLIREVFRHERHSLNPSLDLVVIPRQGVKPNFESIRQSFRYLTKKILRKVD